jgi:hypothetical protein
MPSIKEVQRQLAAFDHAARGAESPDALKASWKRIFHKDLSDAAAKSFARYYKTMRSKTGKHKSRRSGHRGGGGCGYRSTRSRQRGGAAFTLPSTPVNYGMVPGLLTNTYGQFPVEVDTDPASLRDLDVYFHDSLSLSKPGFWPSVPGDMGSNKVGGGRRRSRRARQRTHRRRGQRGGNLLSSLYMRPFPYISTAPPNFVQSGFNSYSGGTSSVPAPASPVSHTWNLSSGLGSPISPGLVTNIDSNFSKLASPAPWQTSN